MTTQPAYETASLGELARHAGAALPPGVRDDAPVSAVTEDSRRVQPGTLFVAAPGKHADGHDFAPQAAAAGAVAVLGAREGATALAGLPYVFHPHPRRALGLIAHRLAGDPSQAMPTVGVTGTNGKTSVCALTARMLNHAGNRAACFGTVGCEIGGQRLPAAHTTPFGEDLARLFAMARAADSTHVIMEVSSHALDQERVAGIHFAGAAFTNLTQDHLDYHGDMARYRAAKLMLFEKVRAAGGFGVVNVDDPQAEAFLAACGQTRCTVGRRGDVHAAEVEHGARRTRFRLESPWGAAEAATPLLGAHNVSNMLVAVGIGGCLGLSVEAMAAALSEAPPVPGRFETIDEGQPFRVIVDYAHTDDGLRNVLEAARAICAGRVIVAFGCGGDRDRAKRPKMGAVAARLADLVVVTSDNPRTEAPEEIIREILPGVEREQPDATRRWVIPDRREAIFHAISLAQPGDLVMIAGKGHEDYQIIGTTKIHFDDREMAREALRRS